MRRGRTNRRRARERRAAAETALEWRTLVVGWGRFLHRRQRRQAEAGVFVCHAPTRSSRATDKPPTFRREKVYAMFENTDDKK